MVDVLDLAGAQARRDLSLPDVVFDPGYGAALQVSDGGDWELAVGAGGRILCAYIRRRLPVELSEGEELYDLVSPYGVTGTWVEPGVTPEAVADFRAALRRELTDRGVVAEFQRLGSLLPGRKALVASEPSASAVPFSETVEVLLDEGYEAFWSGAQGRHRTSVRKARSSGYSWSEAPAERSALLQGGAFRALYDGTMRAVDARPYYFFEDRYYELLQEALGDGLRLARVRDGSGEVVAAALFMRWGDRLHYHLAGSQREAGRKGANNLLLDGMMEWGTRHGIRSVHLGGGLRPGDNLFRFKAQFGGRTLPFWLFRAEIQPERYARLVQRHASATKRTPEELRATGFFPAYRAP